MSVILEWLRMDLVQGILSIGLSILAAFFIDRVVIRGLRWMTGRTRTRVDDLVVEHIRRPLIISVVLLGIYGAVASSPLPHTLHFILVGALESVTILVWTTALLTGTTRIMQAVARKPAKNAILQPRTVPVFDMAAKLAILLVSAYFLFLSWHIDVTGWLASAGVLGIALGFAAKDTLANLFAGIFILADAPYKLGDTICLDSETRGVVTEIGMRSTRILTLNGVEVTVPNALIANGQIANESGGPAVKMRLRIPATVAYGSDVEEVRRVLLSVISGVDHLCEQPAPRVRFMNMGDSALEFSVDVFIDTPTARDDVIDELNTRLYNALNEAGLTIPFPQRDVHLYRED